VKIWNPNNPFLYDIMALEEPEQQTGMQSFPQLQQQAMTTSVAADQHSNVNPPSPEKFFSNFLLKFKYVASLGLYSSSGPHHPLAGAPPVGVVGPTCRPEGERGRVCR
jgi:hypothetical protein